MTLQAFLFARRVPEFPPIGAAQAVLDSQVIPLSFGSPSSETFPFAALQQATHAAIAVQGPQGLQYAGADGPDRVRDWIVARAKQRGIEITPSHVLTTYGSAQAIDFASRTILEPGDEVWVEGPTYFGALKMFTAAEATITAFPADDDGLQVDRVEEELLRRVAQGEALPRLLYCIPNYHNPTGACLTLERRKRLAELAYRYNFFILEDDAYSELSFSADKLPAIYTFAPARTIYLGSFSKIIAPGLRLGWAIASPDVISKLNSFYYGSKASVFMQQVVGNLLQDYDMDQHLHSVNQRYRQQRDTMVNALERYFGNELTFLIPQGGFFIWTRFKDKTDTSALLAYARTSQVSYIPGRTFYHGQSGGADQLRLCYSFCTAAQIETGVARLAEAYRTYRDEREAGEQR